MEQTIIEKMGYKHPKHRLIHPWEGRSAYVKKVLKTYKPNRLLSTNMKTGDGSINLPIVDHCTNQTQRCSKLCYAKKGTISFSLHVLKSEYLSNYLKQTKDLRQLIGECSVFTSVRLNGGGDLLPDHVPAIIKLARACAGTTFWGMSRNKQVLEEINSAEIKNLSLLYSIDATTPTELWKNFKGGLVFGPRLPGDVVPVDDRIRTVFPYHQGGKVKEDFPRHIKDCRAVYNHDIKCTACKRCWVATPLHHKG